MSHQSKSSEILVVRKQVAVLTQIIQCFPAGGVSFEVFLICLIIRKNTGELGTAAINIFFSILLYDTAVEQTAVL